MVDNSQITALNSSYDSFPWFPIRGTHSACQMRSPEPVRLSALGNLQSRWLLQNAAIHKEYKMLQYTKNKPCWSEFDWGWLQNFSNMGKKQLECKCSDRKKAALLSLSLRQKGKGVRRTRCYLLLYALYYYFSFAWLLLYWSVLMVSVQIIVKMKFLITLPKVLP